MKALIALSILLLSSSAFAGETCILTGTVVSASNRPVPSAVVLTDSRSPSPQVDYTAVDGRFRFQVDPAGRQQVCSTDTSLSTQSERAGVSGEGRPGAKRVHPLNWYARSLMIFQGLMQAGWDRQWRQMKRTIAMS